MSAFQIWGTNHQHPYGAHKKVIFGGGRSPAAKNHSKKGICMIIGLLFPPF